MSNKLELTWYGKEESIEVEPRLLIENPELSNTDLDPETQNLLIHGDNLLALKALEQDYAGRVKCIYIDPPYNTGQAFDSYDDNLEHSIWLQLMEARLKILKNLLSSEGLIFIQIDDEEQAYLKVICDEVFGRSNYLNTITVKAKAVAGASGGGEDKRLKKNYEFILVYVGDYTKLTYNPTIERVRLAEYIRDHKKNKIGFYYTRIIVDYGERTYIGTTSAGNGEDIKVYRHSNFKFSSISKIAKEQNISEDEAYSKYYSDVFMVSNAQSTVLTRVNEFVAKKKELISYEYVPSTGKDKGKLTTKYVWNETLIVWLKDSAILEDGIVYKTQRLGTLWTDISWGRLDLEGGVSLKRGKKPERLLRRIIAMATEPGDIVLDSFLGSGTTIAVAHKMKRKWIGVELGEQCYSLCVPRLTQVIEGDQTGISQVVNWQGGGGYRFYELAPSLINKDTFGEDVINSEYDANMLAAAVALHEGFTYQPDETLFWKQSIGTEKSYLFVTTRHVNMAYLDSIKTTMEEDEFLVIACKSYEKETEKTYKRIEMKKIPQMLLGRCEFGREDYNLNIVHPPEYDEDIDCWEDCDEE